MTTTIRFIIQVPCSMMIIDRKWRLNECVLVLRRFERAQTFGFRVRRWRAAVDDGIFLLFIPCGPTDCLTDWLNWHNTLWLTFCHFFSHCGRRWPKPKLRSINRRIDRLITQRGPLTRYNYVLLTTLHEKLAKLRAFAIDRLTDWRKKKERYHTMRAHASIIHSCGEMR